jgi:membrane fusion protein (multidrug efflux system)
VPSAEAQVDRYRKLIRQDAVSEQNLDEAVAALAEAKADVAAAEAAVVTAGINLDFTTIEAPIAGRVDVSTLTQGALVTESQSEPLTTIRTLDPIHVEVTQTSARLLEFRQRVKDGRLRFRGLDVSVKLKLENGQVFPHEGKLELVEYNVDRGTGTFGVRAEFPKPDRLLFPGMYVRAVVEEGIAEDSFLVAQRAVSRNARGEATALFVDQDGGVEQRILQVASSFGNNWLVEDGVGDGDRVIVEGSQFARIGEKARPVEVAIDEATGEVTPIKDGPPPAADRVDLVKDEPASARKD